MLRLPPEGSAARTALRMGRVYFNNIWPPPRQADYREAVGGHWQIMGPLQFEFLKSQGLTPNHRLLDIGCGSLRGGRFFIRYLNPDCYMGFDIYEDLVREGLAKEVPPDVVAAKRPFFAFNDRFDFSAFPSPPDFAMAQSVFTHLTPAQIFNCLANLKSLSAKCRLFATFNESAIPIPNSLFGPSPQRTFYYTQGQLRSLAGRAGWTMRYIGKWGHPRSQRIAEFTAR